MFCKLFFITGISLFSISCFETEDDGIDPVSCNVDSYINAYLNAVDTFNANQTSSNCVNVKNKGLALMNAIRNCNYFEDESYWEDVISIYDNVNCNNL